MTSASVPLAQRVVVQNFLYMFRGPRWSLNCRKQIAVTAIKAAELCHASTSIQLPLLVQSQISNQKVIPESSQSRTNSWAVWAGDPDKIFNSFHGHLKEAAAAIPQVLKTKLRRDGVYRRSCQERLDGVMDSSGKHADKA